MTQQLLHRRNHTCIGRCRKMLAPSQSVSAIHRSWFPSSFLQRPGTRHANRCQTVQIIAHAAQAPAKRVAETAAVSSSGFSRPEGDSEQQPKEIDWLATGACFAFPAVSESQQYNAHTLTTHGEHGILMHACIDVCMPGGGTC